MSITLGGVVHGKYIELEAPPAPIPEGSAVTVHIERTELSIEEKRRLVVATAGSWAEDPSIGRIFAEIADRRRDVVPRQRAFE